jgi:hypothetical protein
MVLSNWTIPSGCSESSERIAPMQTLYDFRRIIYLCEVQGKTLPRLCDIRPGVPLVSQILHSEGLYMPFRGSL